MHLAIDHFTRYVWAIASKTQTAKDFVNLIKQVQKHGTPQLVLADKYTGIQSREFTKFLSNEKIKTMFITTNCAQSNGLVERVNQTLVNRLRCKYNECETKNSWHKLLKECVKEYNNTPHSVTLYSPNYLLTKKLPFSPIINTNASSNYDESMKLALQRTIDNHNKNKKVYDNKHQPFEFKTGDFVIIENKNEISRKKLESLMTGPFEVIRKVSNVIYEVECYKRGKKTDFFHISKLRPYFP
ncbi:uncharacterized protein B4U80_09862 [Leptotrombidium deliense]|uniref:Integrase catalytic domain-containing protein n=1 Tax=Leptotrombidium deliense TaxID=299467 RepID=A0A443RX11_9ACAR|nr:uncharacterized protein B4U80_09862 [Leptotrombidium deliense]